MGVPLLTYMGIGIGSEGGGETGQGAQLAARMGGSIMHSAGLPELVAHGLKDYEGQILRVVGEGGRGEGGEGRGGGGGQRLLRMLRGFVEGGIAANADTPATVAALAAVAKLQKAARREFVPPQLSDMKQHARSMEHAFMAAAECRTGKPAC
jgi:hypothetical protein